MSRGEIASIVYQKIFHEAVKDGNIQEASRILDERKDKLNMNWFDRDGQTALHSCCYSGNLELMKLLVRSGANVELCNRDGFSCLHIACYNGHRDIVLYLMNQLR